MVPEILSRIRPPTFPNRDFSIVDYGAVEGGEVLNTNAFRTAIEACNSEGGGRVVVPAVSSTQFTCLKTLPNNDLDLFSW